MILPCKMTDEVGVVDENLNPLSKGDSRKELSKHETKDFKLGLWIVYFFTLVTWIILGTSTFSYTFSGKKDVLMSAYDTSCGLYAVGPLGAVSFSTPLSHFLIDYPFLSWVVFFFGYIAYHFMINHLSGAIGLSNVQKTLRHMIDNHFICGVIYSIVIFIIFASTYQKETVPYFKESEDSNAYNCWKYMWENTLILDDIAHPPHETLQALYSQDSSCNTSALDNDTLTSYLDELMALRNSNYNVTNCVFLILVHLTLRMMAFAFFSFRDTEHFGSNGNEVDVPDPRVSFPNISDGLMKECVKIKSWLDAFVEDYIDTYDYDITKDPRHLLHTGTPSMWALQRLQYRTHYYKSYVFLSLFIVVVFTLVTAPLSEPSDVAQHFMINYSLNLYAGPYWTVVTSNGGWYFTCNLIALLILLNEWYLLMTTVYDRARVLQYKNTTRARTLLGIINAQTDPSRPFSSKPSQLFMLR